MNSLITISGWIVAIVSLGLSIYQIYRTEKVKKVNIELKKEIEGRDEDKYRKLFSDVESLIKELDIACNIVNTECVAQREQCSRVTSKVNGAMVSAEKIADSCFTFNDNHKKIYGYRIVNDLRNRLTREPCVTGGEKRN